MKYKLQTLSKIEKLEHQVRALEIAINRGNSVQEINVIVDRIKELTESIRNTVSIENDEWN
jgi:UV DNA damage repair endonuclease